MAAATWTPTKVIRTLSSSEHCCISGVHHGPALACNGPLLPHKVLPMRLSLARFPEESDRLPIRLKTSISPEQSKLPWLWQDAHSSCHWQVSGPRDRETGVTLHWLDTCMSTARHWSRNRPNHQSSEFKYILHFTTSPNTFPTEERKATQCLLDIYKLEAANYIGLHAWGRVSTSNNFI